MAMLIADLLYMYGLWLFATALFVWLATILYRLSRNTFGPVPEAPARPTAAAVVNLPPQPTRKPRVPLTRAA
ncbi:hypothetical protein IDT60_20720 (plasmid) [Pseudarthrobacter sp. BIM B-2242]|nr:hypothetical protein IDT60_20720 [Pseudarthrobacter sp. BIM B-2242]